jgi:hypothetical protein
MSATSHETPVAGYHPYGALSRVWERGVFIGLGACLPIVLGSLPKILTSDAALTPTGRAIWLMYAFVQVASKTPISFAYGLSGWRAALDLAGFATLLAATVVFALGQPVHVPTIAWQCGGLLVAASVAAVALAPMQVDLGSPAIPLPRELFAKTMSFLVTLPMLAALGLLAFP